MPTLDIVEEKREDEPSPPAPTPAGGDGESGPRAGLRPRLPRAAAAAPAPPREKAPSAPAPRSAGTWSAAWDAMLAAGWRWTRAPVGGSVLYVAPSCASYARDELLEYAKTDLSAVRRGRDLFETLGDVQRHAREVLGHEWDEEGGCRTMRLPRSLRLADSRAPNPAPPAAALPEGAGEEEGETVFVTVPPGSLGVTVHTSGPSFGVVELVQATCKFADSVSRGDRIATVDGRKVVSVDDLTMGSGGERIVGIVKMRMRKRRRTEPRSLTSEARRLADESARAKKKGASAESASAGGGGEEAAAVEPARDGAMDAAANAVGVPAKVLSGDGGEKVPAAVESPGRKKEDVAKRPSDEASQKGPEEDQGASKSCDDGEMNVDDYVSARIDNAVLASV